MVFRRHVRVCAWLLCFAIGSVHTSTALGQAAVGTSQIGTMAVIVMDDGGFYISDYNGGNDVGYPQRPWTYCGNVFAATGTPPDRVIGMGGALVMTARGSVYEIRGGCIVLSEFSTSPPAGDEFVAFGARIGGNGCHVYAVTKGGVVLRKYVYCGGKDWEPAGALPVGPTPADPHSWGGLKVRYR